jgi:alpha-amylase/alpha-mannosidase (GH57 family)
MRPTAAPSCASSIAHLGRPRSRRLPYQVLARFEAQPLDHIFPGSWINANFRVWIGHAEDNLAWELLLAARRAYDRAHDVPEAARKVAYEELLIAEGSDWNWWYGPEHGSANDAEFDSLYRKHLTGIYNALGEQAPDELAPHSAIGSAR